MTPEAWSLWLLIAGMAAVTFALRASFLLLPASVAIPPLLRRSLRFVPAAVLTAIWVPELVIHHGALFVSWENARLVAGAAAIAAAWRWGRVYLTIFAGIGVLHLADWLIRELRAASLL
jgi:branched-subunit amino acid transport protein